MGLIYLLHVVHTVISEKLIGKYAARDGLVMISDSITAFIPIT